MYPWCSNDGPTTQIRHAIETFSKIDCYPNPEAFANISPSNTNKIHRGTNNMHLAYQDEWTPFAMAYPNAHAAGIVFEHDFETRGMQWHGQELVDTMKATLQRQWSAMPTTNQNEGFRHPEYYPRIGMSCTN